MKKYVITILLITTALLTIGCSPKPEASDDGNIRSTQTENIDAPEDMSSK